MTLLPRDCYTAAAVRELDRQAIDHFGLTELTLMERAGEAAFALLQRRWPQARRVLLLCGPGNNGGDGFVVARLAAEAGMAVEVVLAADADHLGGAAAQTFAAMTATGMAAGLAGRAVTAKGVDTVTSAVASAADSDFDVIVDALLGTGLGRDVEGDMAAMIQAVNASRVPILALDIPSGLQADTGQVLGIAVQAVATMSFVGLKQGLLLGQGPACCGVLAFDDLQLPSVVYAEVPVAMQRFDYAGLVNAADQPLQPRPRCAHKGDFGHVWLVGGDVGMAGAVRMAAEAALRVGTGRVSVMTRMEHVAQVGAGRPELMVHGLVSGQGLADCLATATVVAIGPGLGQGDWGRASLAEALDISMVAGLPLVIDADALNLLAHEPCHYDRWVLTPHPAEAARLLALTTAAAVQADRVAAAQAIQQRYGGVCILKGAGTVVQTAGETWVCSEGNPGMASGGMGDVLTGVLAGLIAQGLPLAEAAVMAVAIHARAADIVAVEGERGMLAMDLMPWLRRLVNPVVEVAAEFGTVPVVEAL